VAIASNIAKELKGGYRDSECDSLTDYTISTFNEYPFNTWQEGDRIEVDIDATKNRYLYEKISNSDKIFIFARIREPFIILL
ncbi:8087_t:CDS:2, partial [Entrophospora sp. SA101]